ncbi:chorismate mutase [Virgibacillus sp. NKC19-3]|uniref:chorismate mutase n=1 Tax=Virgibacillus saliphilus TaxID=2831674 RepID=UPI001C9A7687|nr:chorismate mutase [Virgibacillus sp. NKC19-3]MBY7143492.1 chorismate mutase [Virgibacillus sp. NKC19-3]
MTRGVRGATTVLKNEENQIIMNTKDLIEEMVAKNNIQPSDISHVFISVTQDLNAGFPSKALREFSGWTYVPVMCMREIDVPGSLQACIRIMMVVNTNKDQQDMQHIYHNQATQLRPDLLSKRGE